jgi:hypothetical protein
MRRQTKEKGWRNGRGLQACQTISSSANSMSPQLGATRRKRERGERKLLRPRGLPGCHSHSSARAPPPFSSSTPDANQTLQRLRHSHVRRLSHPRFTVRCVAYVSLTADRHTADEAAECILHAAIIRSGLQALLELAFLHCEGGGGLEEQPRPLSLTGYPSRRLAEHDRREALHASWGGGGGGGRGSYRGPRPPSRSSTLHAISHTPPHVAITQTAAVAAPDLEGEGSS